jgi:hypothetical protein
MLKLHARLSGALPKGIAQGSHIVADPIYAPSSGYNKNLRLRVCLDLAAAVGADLLGGHSVVCGGVGRLGHVWD